MDTSGLITIDEVIADIQVELDDFSEGNVMHYARLIERGVTQMNLFNLHNLSVVKLDIDTDSKTAPLPSDYLRYKRIGAILPNGRVYPLTADDDMMLANEENCAVEGSYEGVEINDTSIYSARGGYSEAGSYRIDNKRNRILLYKVDATKIVMEYVSSGLKIDGKTYVQEIAREALLAYAIWKSSKQGTINRDRSMNEFLFEQKKLRNLMMPSMDEIIDSLLQGESSLKF